MKRSTKFTAALTAAIVALSGCGAESAPVSAKPSAISVGAEAARVGSIQKETSYAGRISPGESVYVIGKVPGTVLQTYAEVGDTVKAGELLYEIDPVDVQMSVNQAKAAYESAQASIDQALGSTLDGQVLSSESAYKQAKFAYDAAEDALDSLYEKYNPIHTALKKIEKGDLSAAEDLANALAKLDSDSDSGSNSGLKDSADGSDVSTDPSEETDTSDIDALVEAGKKARDKLSSAIDQAEISYDQAKIAYTTARTAMSLTKGEATEQAQAVGSASLEQAKVAYDSALAQLDYCKVTSPIDGVVELKNVSENGMATSSSYSYVISNKDTMCVTFGVSAEAARTLETGDVITVENGSIVHEAVIVEIATMVDQTSGLFKIKANITDDSSDLLTGVVVKLTATTAHSENAVLIPTSALYYDDGSAYVYVAKDGTAVKTPVETGILSGDDAEILTGLSQGDLVITTWNTNLRDGAAVTVQEG